MSQKRNISATINSVIDMILLLSVFFLTNFMTFSLAYQFPDFSFPKIFFWVFLAFGILVLLFIRVKLLSLLSSCLRALRSQIFIVAFLIYNLLSLFWTVDINSSIAELSLFLLATFLGIYVAIRFAMNDFYNFTLFFSYFSVIVSYIFIFFLPAFGLFDNPQFSGVWRGFFWHKNHLGIVMAFFSSLFLLKSMLTHWKKIGFFVNLGFFFASILLILGSRSATGILIFVLLIGMQVIMYFWFRLRQHLKKIHYLLFSAFICITLFISFFNLGKIFGLLGRSTSLTGRIALWKNLLTVVWIKEPILGYGFGGLWNQETFRIDMKELNGWLYPPFFSDNGFLDILLGLGIVGLSLFLIVFIIAGFRSFNNLIRNPSLINFLPCLVFLFLVFANIAYSYFFEIEQFSWLLLVSMSIYTNKKGFLSSSVSNSAVIVE